MADPARLIGGIVFPDIDQVDFTGPFEVLSRLPNATFLVIGKTTEPVLDVKGLVLTPQIAYADVPQLDVLLIPGGTGVNSQMEDEATLSFLRSQAGKARLVFAVCAGALLGGAAGLLKGKRATTHWASHHLLPSFGAIAENARVVVDGNLVTAAGVTSGFDGALRVAALLCGDQVAQEIQLYLEYAPEPPFHSGSPDTAPAEIVSAVKNSMRSVLDERQEIADRYAKAEKIAGRTPDWRRERYSSSG